MTNQLVWSQKTLDLTIESERLKHRLYELELEEELKIYREALEEIRQKDSHLLEMSGYRKNSFGYIADNALNQFWEKYK